MSNDNGIAVCCRIRPTNKVEASENSKHVLNFTSEKTVRIDMGVGAHDFAFDRVFTPDATQEEVYSATAKPLITEIMNGYNCTVFVYGQTGSGKSHTMMGALGSDKEEGIIPRMVGSLFDSIQNAPSNLEFTVRVSYVEIYLEKLRDLLNPVNDNLNVREGAVGSSGARSVWIEGVTEMYVGSVAEILRLIEAGASSRAIAATRMNLESSRSHSVFIITLQKTDTETGVKTTSTLFLVDLAGSEKVEKTGAQGQTMKEAQHINKSLSALGNVINALTTGAPHVPYRDSKLTRLLSDALGGNAKTCLIITGSAQSYNAEETLSTMRFGQRAKKIQNKAVVNQELTVAQYKALLAQKERQNEATRAACAELVRLLQEADIPFDANLLLAVDPAPAAPGTPGVTSPAPSRQSLSSSASKASLGRSTMSPAGRPASAMSQTKQRASLGTPSTPKATPSKGSKSAPVTPAASIAKPMTFGFGTEDSADKVDDVSDVADAAAVAAPAVVSFSLEDDESADAADATSDAVSSESAPVPAEVTAPVVDIVDQQSSSKLTRQSTSNREALRAATLACSLDDALLWVALLIQRSFDPPNTFFAALRKQALLCRIGEAAAAAVTNPVDWSAAIEQSQLVQDGAELAAIVTAFTEVIKLMGVSEEQFITPDDLLHAAPESSSQADAIVCYGPRKRIVDCMLAVERCVAELNRPKPEAPAVVAEPVVEENTNSESTKDESEALRAEVEALKQSLAEQVAKTEDASAALRAHARTHEEQLASLQQLLDVERSEASAAAHKASKSAAYSAGQLGQLQTALQTAAAELEKKTAAAARAADDAQDELDSVRSELEIARGSMEAERERGDKLQTDVDKAERAAQEAIVSRHELDAQMRSMQHTYAQQELKLESMSTQLAKVPELENRVAELNRALASKVSQALQTAMQLEEAKAEVSAFEKAMSDASAAVPDGQNNSFLHARMVAENERLQREIRRMTASQTQREIQLQTEFGTAFAEIRSQHSAEVERLRAQARQDAISIDQFVNVLQDNSRLYKEQSERDRLRISELDAELAQYRKFYDNLNSNHDERTRSGSVDQAAPALGSNVIRPLQGGGRVTSVPRSTPAFMPFTQAPAQPAEAPSPVEPNQALMVAAALGTGPAPPAPTAPALESSQEKPSFFTNLKTKAQDKEQTCRQQ